MGYINKNLLREENVVHWSRPHWIIFAPSASLLIFSFFLFLYLPAVLSVLSGFTFFGISIATAISLFIFLLALFQGLKAYIMYRTTEYGITNKRVLMKVGWIQRRSIEIFLNKIEAIYVEQSVAGRILSYGTIVIIGTGGTRDPLRFIPNPLEFRKAAQRQVDSNPT